MFDDFDFCMECLKDELEIAQEFVDNKTAMKLGNANSGNNNTNTANNNNPASIIQDRLGAIFGNLGITNNNNAQKTAPGSASAQNAKPATPVRPKNAVPSTPAPKSTTSTTPSSTAAKITQSSTSGTSTPAQTTQSTPANQTTSANKPVATNTGVMYGPTRKPFEQMSTSELQKDSANRMGRINQMISQMKADRIARANSPVGRSVQSAQAHYNTITNNGTQSVPAGAKPTTVYTNTGDPNAARAAATAQRNEIFKTQQTPTNTSTNTSSSNPPTRGGPVPKTR